MICIDQCLTRRFAKLTKCAVPDNFAIDISDDEEEPGAQEGQRRPGKNTYDGFVYLETFLKCSHCPKIVLGGKEQMRLHVRKEQPTYQHQCQYCDKVLW